MPGTAYPSEPLYRYPYTKLSEAQIGAALDPKAKSGPNGVSPRTGALAGKSIDIVTDKGPKLSYRFAGADRLTLAEGGAAPVEAGYGALDHHGVLFLTHMIPGTLRGYATVIDQATGLATVFELWFAGYQDKREVMREIWYGYVDQPGREAPRARHAVTNRVEGKAFHWTQDTGARTLEFYPSASYSHFVELTRLDGRIGYCGPSDYVKINDDLYIYTRTESEFSGIFTAYVMDLNRQEQIGMRLGFNGADELEYYIFRGKGEWLGQIAQFEKFGDTSGAPVPPPKPGKGERRVYRPIHTFTKLTPAEIAVAAKTQKVFEKRTSMAGNGSDPTDWLAGKKFTIRYDNGPAMAYEVVSGDTLRWRNGTGAWTEARYQAWESMPGVILFGHLLDGTKDHEGHMVVADFEAGLASCYNGYVNTPYIANEAYARTLFGVIDMDGLKPPPRGKRHTRTDELLGTALTWNYAPGLTSMHLYSTPETVSWIIFTESGHGGSEWAGPGSFIKIREGLYFVYWLEPACNGSLGTILINMRTMHDVGIGYHCDEKGMSLGQIGAHSRHAGRFDIKRFFKA